MNSTFENRFVIGLRYIQRKEYAAALRYFIEASRISPDHCSTWGNIGFCLSSLNRHQEAIEAYEKLISLCPQYLLIARISIGESELALGNLDRAATVIDGVLREAPEMPEAWIAASNYYSMTSEYHKMMQCSEKAIALNPGLAIAHLNHGWALLNMEDYSAALTATNTALKLDENNVQALVNASTIYLEAGDYWNSIAMANRALSLQANCIDALLNFAKAKKEQGDHRTALTTLNRLSVENTHTLLTRSEILNDIGETDDAIRCLQRAIDEYNGNTQPEILHSLGAMLLKRGDFNTGFKLYEYRKKPEITRQCQNRREPSVGKNVCKHPLKTLITKEQGVGDNILFASLLPEARAQGRSIYLEVDSRLHRLYKRSFGADIQLFENDDSLHQIEFDEVISIGSLGNTYRSSKEDFSRQPTGFLKADQKESQRIRKEMINRFSAKTIIGISWFSEGIKRQNRKKCIEFKRLVQSIQSKQDCIFINLQYGWEDFSKEEKREIKQQTNIFTPEIDLRNNFDDIATHLDACDAIITVSTSLAHLACALGKETNILLPLSAIWHWGSDPEKTVWYPTAKLYRQEELDNWEATLARLSYDLGRRQYRS